MSDKLWIFWVTSVPATIVTVVLWQSCLAYNDPIVQFFMGWLGRAHVLFKRIKVQRQRIPEKTGEP